MTTQTVTIRYKVDSSGALVATGAVVKTTQQVGQAAQSTNRALAQQASQVKSLQGLLANYTQQLRSLFGLYLTFQGVQIFSQFVDEFTNLNGRLAVTITNTNAYAQAQRDVYAISQETYTSLASTANLYARLTVSLEEMNATQQEVAGITRTINQALLVSGATTAEANSAIIQLSQSFASGVLRGEEFNAVNEAGPRIMAALAKSLKVSRGALREMASEGKLTAEVLRKALVEDAANIAQEASNVPLTIGRGWQSFRNDLMVYIGTANESMGVSKAIAEGLRYIGKNIDSLASKFISGVGYIAAFIGLKGLLGIVSAAETAGGAIILLQQRATILGLALGGMPALIAGVTIGLVALGSYFLSTSETIDNASAALERFRELSLQSPTTAMRDMTATFDEVSARIDEIKAKLADPNRGWLDRAENIPLVAELRELEEQLTSVRGNMNTLMTSALQPLEEAFDRARGKIGNSAEDLKAFTNNQLQLNDALIASGAPLGKQIKAAQDMRNALESLRGKIDGVTYTQADFNREQKAVIANYQREIQSINSVGALKASDRNRTIAQASAQERLNNIIAQYSREQDDANKVLKQLEGVQREVNNILARFPNLAEDAKAALELLGRAADEARDPLRGFREEVQRLTDGANINQTSAQLALLAAALEDAFNAGDTARADEIVRAMERIEQQAGLSMSAADELRERNEELSEAARRQAEAYQQYWVDAFGSIADTIGEFVANGMKDWKSFGKSLLNTVKKIVADIISEFIKLKVINPMLNQLLGTNLQTGGQGLLGSLFGGGSGGGSNFGGLLSSLFGSGTNSARLGINQVNVINGTTGPSGGAGGFFSGGGMMQNGFSMGGMMGAGGGIMMGLQGIRTGNALQGAAGGAMAGMSIGGPWGALIGGIIGGLGALIRGKKPPDFRFGGENANVRNPEGGFETVFGRVRAGSREISWESVVQPMQQFDQTIQALVQSVGGGDEQIDRIRVALSRWSVDLKGDAATAEAILGSRFNAIMGTFEQHIQDFVGSAGTVEERVGRLADALAIDRFAESGELLSSFEDLADVLTRNRVGTEQIVDTYARVLGSTTLLESALAASGVSLDMTRLDFIQFATDITTAAGGLERASQLWEGFLLRFYSEEARTLFAAEQARARATTAFSEIGLDFGEFDNATGMARFRQMFKEQLPNLSAEAIVAWLEAGNALADLVDITTSYNAVLEESVEAVTSLADLMSTVESEIAEFGGETQTFSQRIQAVNTDLEALIAQAVALGAGEKEIARIRELGVLRVNAILEEQRAALGAYSSFVGQFASSNSGLSQFQRSLQQIADESAAAAAEANRLAVAAGLTGANAEDLANIQMRAAEAMAAAALALEESIRGLAGQLDYIQEAGEGSRFPTYFTDDWFRFIQGLSTTDIPRIDSKRFDLVAQLSRQVRELSEFTGESILGVLDRMRIPFNRVIEDFGVSISALGNSEVFDRFVTASRTLGIEVSEASARLGVNVGQLADANSMLNNGFERALSRLPAAVNSQITGLLRNLETAVGPEAQEAARRQLSDFVNAQTPAIREALAPFLDDVDTTSVESQQLAAADQTNRYLSAANDYLQRIATNTAVPATPGGPNPRPGDKATSAEKETHRLLAALLASMQNLEREQRSRNQKAVIGANNG